MDNPFAEILERLSKQEQQQSEILSLLKEAKPQKKLLTKHEYAKAVKKSITTIDRWVSSGKLTPTIIAGCRYFEDPNAGSGGMVISRN
ncbi:hypothetical protein [Soonwooa sp.]|uniref:hypothetical protein n=1 Tax=Soonwooa sp. TaxID=1938592 RepID=UPI0028A9B022|nr:hypothetical protein [Soonwooa sp.]